MQLVYVSASVSFSVLFDNVVPLPPNLAVDLGERMHCLLDVGTLVKLPVPGLVVFLTTHLAV
jgi:hypothetical protein